MNYSLPADIELRIDALVASGDFSSRDEVLDVAIKRIERWQYGLNALREMVDVAEEDVSAGRVGTFNREDVWNDVRDRLADDGIGD